MHLIPNKWWVILLIGIVLIVFINLYVNSGSSISLQENKMTMSNETSADLINNSINSHPFVIKELRNKLINDLVETEDYKEPHTESIDYRIDNLERQIEELSK